MQLETNMLGAMFGLSASFVQTDPVYLARGMDQKQAGNWTNTNKEVSANTGQQNGRRNSYGC